MATRGEVATGGEVAVEVGSGRGDTLWLGAQTGGRVSRHTDQCAV